MSEAKEAKEASKEASKEVPNKKDLMLVYLLRHFNCVNLGKNMVKVDDVSVEVIKTFTSLEMLKQHCLEHKIKLGIDYEWDTSWQNYASNVWVAHGYDYIIMDIEQVLTYLIGTKITGESFTE